VCNADVVKIACGLPLPHPEASVVEHLLVAGCGKTESRRR
jgi:hypothetical protein